VLTIPLAPLRAPSTLLLFFIPTEHVMWRPKS
jgi:hypothetical protein